MPPQTPAQATVFLDRDGTLNVDHGYVHSSAQFEFIPGVPQALQRLQQAGLRLIVVTNQSGVARGYYPESAVAALHAHMDRCLSTFAVHISAYYYCPFHPDYGDAHYRRASPDRKPGIGMFERAQQEFAIDVERSFMVGDTLSDMLFAQRAGLQPILVQTGQGAANTVEPRLPPQTWVVTDLSAATHRILQLQPPANPGTEPGAGSSNG